MFQTKVVEKIKTHFIIKNFFLFENRAVNEIILKNSARPVRPQVTIWRMRIACWIREATDAYSEYMTGLCIACLCTSEDKPRKVHVFSRIYVAQA